MNRSDKRSILADLTELLARARDANCQAMPWIERAHAELSAECQEYDSRPSQPPSPNAEKRRTASQLFQSARAILRGIK